jgi:pimeloyl-ACP methyl ester carboxylesterase
MKEKIMSREVEVDTAGYQEVPTMRVLAENGVNFAYRDLGIGELPLLMFQHFRGNLDNWDPALIDALAAKRRVVAMDNAGVGGSSGTTPDTIDRMARDAIQFVNAMDLDRIDMLGYSIGSFVAQEVALARPELVNRMVLASAAPQGAPGMHGWAPAVIGAVGQPGTNPEGYLSVFYTNSPDSKSAGRLSLGRMNARHDGRDTPTTCETKMAQYDAVCRWGIPQYALLQRLEGIDCPVFVANGDRDPMILPRYSHLLAGLLPDAQLKIYPDSAHGFLFQHHSEFASDVNSFLSA